MDTSMLRERGNANTGNYVLIENITSANPSLTFARSGREPITGIQLVDIPEPATAVLSAFGFLSLLSRRR